MSRMLVFAGAIAGAVLAGPAPGLRSGSAEASELRPRVHGVHGQAARRLPLQGPHVGAAGLHRQAHLQRHAHLQRRVARNVLAGIHPFDGFARDVIFTGDAGSASLRTVNLNIANIPPAVAGIRPSPMAAPVIYRIESAGRGEGRRGGREGRQTRAAADDGVTPRIVIVRLR